MPRQHGGRKGVCLYDDGLLLRGGEAQQSHCPQIEAQVEEVDGTRGEDKERQLAECRVEDAGLGRADLH